MSVTPSGRPKPPSGEPPRTTPSSRPSAPSGRPSDPSSELAPLGTPRDRFAVGLLLPIAVAALAANLVGGLLAPGWLGVVSEKVADRWRIWGTVLPLAAAFLGIGGVISLAMAAVANPRTSVSTRIVSTFGAGLVLTLVAAAFRNILEPTHLIVLFAGSFAVLVSSAVEALAPPATRALGVQLALLALTALMRVGAWGLAWSATHKGHPNAMSMAQAAASCALVLELLAQAFAVLYLVYRPGFRGAIAAVFAITAAFALSMWTLRTTFDANTAGSARDALQRAMSLRVQGSGPLPSWIDAVATQQEIALIEPRLKLPLLPLVFAEFASMTIAVSALASASRLTLPLVAAVALATLSRGQVDTPLRALELSLAALGALVLARGLRVRSRNSDRPPPASR